MPADGDRFWVDVQEDYNAVVPSKDDGPPMSPDEVIGWEPELRASGLFRTLVDRRHLQEISYTADEYIDVLGTYSNNLSLPADQRDELFRRIHRRIENAGGVVTKHQLVSVTVGRI
jgi:hypothetical protein